MTNTSGTIGIVLCGGESSRMGTDKGTLVYKELPQRYHVYHLLEPFCEQVYLSVKAGAETDIIDNYRFFCDLGKYKNAGPMTAVLSAFELHPGKNLLIAGCDYPYLESRSFAPLLDHGDGNIHCYTNEEGFEEPLIAFYPAGIFPVLKKAFEDGMNSLRRFCRQQQAATHIPENALWVKSIDDPEQRKSYMEQEIQSNKATTVFNIKRFRNDSFELAEDHLVTEEPLEIRLVYNREGKRFKKNISVTMRTPGNDAELALGFLFTEGIISGYQEVENISYARSLKHGEKENIIQVELTPSAKPDLERLERHFYTTSSCGVCGKTSIELIRQAAPPELPGNNLKVTASFLFLLPEALRKSQEIFESTGGLHAAALFSPQAKMLVLREDIGRHNAVDKVIGFGLKNNQIPFDRHVLLLSGRGGFELVQKAIMAGIKIVASVGAPSSLSVELAREFNITLIGFLKPGRFNIYSGEERVDESF